MSQSELVSKNNKIMITIFQAKKIHTLNPSNPIATHIAVNEDGMILGVGGYDDVAGWGEHNLDDSFADKIITPGFVEAHAHVMAGGMMTLPFLGYFERARADGTIAPGIKSYEELITALKDEDAKLKDPDRKSVV